MGADTGPYLVAITLFLSIAYTIRSIVEARARTKLLQANAQEQLVLSILKGEERRRRQSSLRWGVILTFLGAGFMIVELMDWRHSSPGVLAVVLGATGLGNIASYLVCRKAEEPD